MVYCLLMYKYALNMNVWLLYSVLLHIYIGGMLWVWPIHVMTFDPTGHFKWMITYILDMYSLNAFDCI